MDKNHMAIDQFGQTFHNLGPHPRKELLRRLGRRHADKMYVDNKSGQSKHIGWIIATLWISVYEVKALEN